MLVSLITTASINKNTKKNIMEKNRITSQPSFLKKILLVLIASFFSISSSYSYERKELIKKEDVDFIYRVPQATWSKDVKNAVVDVTLIVDAEDKDKLKMLFLFFQFCNKPDERWFYGFAPKINNRFTPREWRKYQVGELPLSYSYQSVVGGVGVQLKGGAYYQMTTGKPVDISSMVNTFGKNCGQVFAGYGLGTNRQETYNEMLNQKRFNKVFSTEYGVSFKIYEFKVKEVSTFHEIPSVPIPRICDLNKCP